MENMEKMIIQLDSKLFSGRIFLDSIQLNFEVQPSDTDIADEVFVSDNSTLLAEMSTCQQLLFHTAFKTTSAHVSKLASFNNINIFRPEYALQRNDVVGAYALYALYRSLLPLQTAPDVTVYRSLWSAQKLLPVIILCQQVFWFIPDFLDRYCPLDVPRVDPVDPMTLRKLYFGTFDASLDQRAASLEMQLLAWSMLTQSSLQDLGRVTHDSPNASDSIEKALNAFGTLMLRGHYLVSRASNTVGNLLAIHSYLQTPLSERVLRRVRGLLVAIKGAQSTFQIREIEASEALRYVSAITAAEAVQLLRAIRVRVESLPPEIDIMGNSRRETPYASSIPYVIAAMESLAGLLVSSDTLTLPRQVVMSVSAGIALCVVNVADKESAALKNLLGRLVQLANFRVDMLRACSLKFLFLNYTLLSPMLESVYESTSPTSCAALQSLLHAFADGVSLGVSAAHLPSPKPLLLRYENYLYRTVQGAIVQPLCRDIEMDLRLHAHHNHLEMKQEQELKENRRLLEPYIRLEPLRVLGYQLHIRRDVQHYLNGIFYNLTTFALHDWRIYTEMRALAQMKYKLQLVDYYLPMGSLEQGIDALQIMRNIHVFVKRFTYDMNSQYFVEFRTDNASKHVNTVQLESVVASLRQHGLGVLNTAVNFTYQFLTQKFHVFSLFLNDDYIRAMKFLKDMRRLGGADRRSGLGSAGDDVVSYLDEFRLLITEIGNALGYVRMLRTASLRCCRDTLKYLPDMSSVPQFKDMLIDMREEKKQAGENSTVVQGGVEEEQKGAVYARVNYISDKTMKAAEVLDDTIRALSASFALGEDYFKILVKVFETVFTEEKLEHLKGFFMIVPSLTVTWIDASIQAKDNIYRTIGKGFIREMYFADDGFPLGLAFCLAVLRQSRSFESLHWFEAYNATLVMEKKRLDEDRIDLERNRQQRKKQRSAQKGFFGSFFTSAADDDLEEEEDSILDPSQINAINMENRRVESRLRETEQLFHSLYCAEVFFKRADDVEL
eukprot:gene515-547_t